MRQIIKPRSRPKLRALSVALTVFLLSAVLTSAVYAAGITTTVDSIGDMRQYTSLALKSGNITVSNSSFNENAHDGISLGGDWGNTADGPCPLLSA